MYGRKLFKILNFTIYFKIITIEVQVAFGQIRQMVNFFKIPAGSAQDRYSRLNVARE